MTTVSITGLDAALTTATAVIDWVNTVADLTTPDTVVWCDGSDSEWRRLTTLLVDKGTFRRLSKKPNSFWCTSDPEDVARVEDRTFICSQHPSDAGPTNNWMDPVDMKTVMTEEYRGAMTGRTMYVIAFCMGPLDAAEPKFGVQITDSEYVAVSMQIMTRSGTPVWKTLDTGADFVRCLHSVGSPMHPGQHDVAWPCDRTKYIVHFPEERTIWSYGSGYGGNALLGKKCYALRIASKMANEQGWLAEHMLILKLTSPEQRVHYIAAAFPSSCGKTNLAMLAPTLSGWTAETIGDDIAWMRFGGDGRLYAVNPEAGFFGVAPGTGAHTNPHAMATIGRGNSIFTNVALTDDGDIWWEGMTADTPAHLTDWKRQDWTPESKEPAAHPNSRYCTPIAQCPTVAPEWSDAAGVPISAIFFGGRRATTIPLVTQSLSWQHGVFLASTLSSETTAAATGTVGVVRRDPMAMLPFLGYHVCDYFQHWLDIGANKNPDVLPKIFYVNWFRRGDDGTFLWPGFGDNSRVLKWALQRLEGSVDALRTPIGDVPFLDDLDLEGLDRCACDDAKLLAALKVDPSEWASEIESIDEWYAAIGENKLPGALRQQLGNLKKQLAAARSDATDRQDGAMPNTTPAAAWKALKEGNERFVRGKPEHPSQGAQHRASLATTQEPTAVIFGCADSRVAAELIFDQGLGDMFVVRTAGHTTGTAVLGSIEYAVTVLNVPLIVVLGHDSCSAITAALAALDEGNLPGGYVRDVVERVTPSILLGRRAGLTQVDEFEKQHVRETVAQLMARSTAISERAAAGTLAILGVTYRLADGRAVLCDHVGGTLMSGRY